jgi:hypothetical protein
MKKYLFVFILTIIAFDVYCQFQLNTISSISGERLQANCIAARYSSSSSPNDGQFVLAKLNDKLVLQFFYMPGGFESKNPLNYDNQVVQFDFYDANGTLQDHSYIKIEGVGKSGNDLVFDMTINSLIEKFIKYSTVKVMVRNSEKLTFSLKGFSYCKKEIEK